jgi:L-2-hydroxyglutarate oxidase
LASLSAFVFRYYKSVGRLVAKIADFLVIGAGLVGLATALRLLQAKPGASVVVVDKEPAVAMHQSGNNSGVIHTGIYYRPGSMKQRLVWLGHRS